MSDAELQKVDAAIDALLEAHDPSAEGYEEFRGHQFDHGLAWVMYPEGHGGLGVRPQLQRHVNQRLGEAGAPPMDGSMFFIALAGPTIVTHGSEEVKKRFLRPMFTGEEKWCQLFSEPGAGSDFAGLGTKAVQDGDEWIVNGQKVWNTLAHIADWGMLVTRTDPDMPKHKGMTYFALDMKAEGVEVRPLRQITGEAEFNEVYMTDVRVPDDCRIGERGEGWRAALTTLMNERTAIGGVAESSRWMQQVKRIAKETPVGTGTLFDDPAFRRRIAELEMRHRAVVLANLRTLAAAQLGHAPGAESSILKIVGTEIFQEITELAMDAMGHDALGWKDCPPEVLPEPERWIASR